MDAQARRRSGPGPGWVASLLAACVGASADARPAEVRDTGQALTRAVRRALHCEQTRLRAGRPLDCAPALPDPARRLVEDVVALAYGELATDPVPGGAARLPRQLGCQWAIARAAARLAAAGPGPGAAAGAADLAAACRAPVASLGDGRQLPALGPQCAAAIGPPGGAVDAGALHACLATLLPRWVERALGDPAPLRPNIVLVFTDDQRFDSVDGTHLRDGQPAMPATFDEIAAAGIHFSESFVTNPVCGPSRASLLTGEYTHSHGVLRNAGARGGARELDDRSTLATWLQDAGYRTGFFGKYVNTYQTLRAERGATYVPPGWNDWRALADDLGNTYFDYQLVENDRLVDYGSAPGDYSTDVLAAHALRFVDAAAAAGEPFFVLWSPTAPHSPFLPAPRHEQLLADLDATRPLDAPSFFEADVSDKPAWVQALAPLSPMRALSVFLLRLRQLQMLRSVDEFVAALMARLRELGLADDTLVAFTSDNGYSWGEHRWASKTCVYEECLRVPLELRYPRLVPLPRRDATPVRGIDLAPTLAELAGVGVPARVDGRSLVRVLDGTEREPAEPLHFECYSGSRHTFVGTRDARWKFAEYLSGERELYDLETDPFELENLAGRPGQAARVAALRARALARRPGWPNDLR